MKCLVTGSSGFIGSHLVKALSKKGYAVAGLDLREPKFHKVFTHQVNILEVKRIREIIRSYDFVFHLAGLLGTHELIDNSYNATMINLGGIINILEACRVTGTKLIFASKPNDWLNTYSITKEAAEKFILMYRQEYKIQAVILKWFNVYGPYQLLQKECGYKKFIPHSLVNALHGNDIEIYGNGDQTMDLIHTVDAIGALFAIIDNWNKCEGHTFEAGHWIISVNDVARMICNLTGSKSKLKYLPMRKGEPLKSDIGANISFLTHTTGWKPKIKLTNGLKDTLDWYGEHYKRR